MIEIKSILDTAPLFDIFAFDMWGTIWDGTKIIQGMGNTLEQLNKSKKVVIISNSTELESEMEETFSKRGLQKGVHYEEIYSSGGLFRETLFKREQKFYTFAQPRNPLFNQTKATHSSLEECDYIFIGRPRIFDGEKWNMQNNIDVFKKELNTFRDMNKTLICANPDLLSPVENSEIPALQHGSIAKYYENIGGKVIYFGKPHVDIYKYAIKTNPQKALMIGDTLETDIKGGKEYGMKTLFVKTGISMIDMKRDGFSDIKKYINHKNIIPDYIM